jgi:oxygen-dependent protoporphyrinogen oxidase
MIDNQLKKYPDLYLTGNSYRGIGINDCVISGYKVVDEILGNIQE